MWSLRSLWCSGALTFAFLGTHSALSCGQLLEWSFWQGGEAGDRWLPLWSHHSVSLSFLESICVACTDSWGHYLPEISLSLFLSFLNLDCKLCWIPSEIQVSGIFFFFVSPFSWCQGTETGKFPCIPFCVKISSVLSTKESILCCLSFMRILDPHFGLILWQCCLSHDK